MSKRIIYQLTIDDVHEVAIEIISRKLSINEIESIKEKIADRIDWFDAISGVIRDNFESSEKKINMDPFEFINHYNNFLQEIEGIVKPELLPILQELKETEPEEFISPDTWFINENHARGLVWSLFLKKSKTHK
jgi:hypothetical protein